MSDLQLQFLEDELALMHSMVMGAERERLKTHASEALKTSEMRPRLSQGIARDLF